MFCGSVLKTDLLCIEETKLEKNWCSHPILENFIKRYYCFLWLILFLARSFLGCWLCPENPFEVFQHFQFSLFHFFVCPSLLLCLSVLSGPEFGRTMNRQKIKNDYWGIVSKGSKEPTVFWNTYIKLYNFLINILSGKTIPQKETVRVELRTSWSLQQLGCYKWR